MVETGVHAATDVTGFGLIGHAAGMIEEGEIGLTIDYGSIPLLPGVKDFAGQGLVPGGTFKNRDFRLPIVLGQLDEEMLLILFDPQTSGGLLIALPQERRTHLSSGCMGKGLRRRHHRNIYRRTAGKIR